MLKTDAAGASLAELKAKHGARSRGQLASAVLDALIESGKMPAISRGRAKRAVPTHFTGAVNTRGTIVLPKKPARTPSVSHRGSPSSRDAGAGRSYSPSPGDPAPRPAGKASLPQAASFSAPVRASSHRAELSPMGRRGAVGRS